MDGFPRGQRGQTVNLLQIASVVRIHLHPFSAGVAEQADAQDLKSCCGNTVPVRFRSPALLIDAQIAQLVEQRTENPRVTGSIPVLGIPPVRV